MRGRRYWYATGRNSPCPCESGKKYKLCCLSQDRIKHRDWVLVYWHDFKEIFAGVARIPGRLRRRAGMA